MKIKVIVLLLVLGVISLSGCVGNEQKSPGNNTNPTETVTSTVNVTPVETVSPGGNATPVETMTQAVNITPSDNETPADNETLTSGIRSYPYLIRLSSYRAFPSSLSIKEGDTVAWRNEQDNPKRNFILVSQQNLFENKTLVYGRTFAYTFNETGGYSFTVIGQPRMNVNVSVTA